MTIAASAFTKGCEWNLEQFQNLLSRRSSKQTFEQKFYIFQQDMSISPENWKFAQNFPMCMQ